MSRRAAEILPENHITTNGFVPDSQPLQDINNTKACPNTSKNSSTTNYNKNNPSAMSFHANKMALHQQNTVAKSQNLLPFCLHFCSLVMELKPIF